MRARVDSHALLKLFNRIHAFLNYNVSAFSAFSCSAVWLWLTHLTPSFYRGNLRSDTASVGYMAVANEDTEATRTKKEVWYKASTPWPKGFARGMGISNFIKCIALVHDPSFALHRTRKSRAQDSIVTLMSWTFRTARAACHLEASTASSAIISSPCRTRGVFSNFQRLRICSFASIIN